MNTTTGETNDKGIIGIIPGSWETPDNWDLLRAELKDQGHDSLVVDNLPVQDPEATRADHAQAAAEKLQSAGAPINLLVAYSAGGLTAPETVDRLSVPVRHVAYLSASLGNPEPHTLNDPTRRAIPSQRSSKEFRRSIKTLPNGMTSIEGDDARRLLFSKVRKEVAELAIKNLQPQYRPADPPLPESHEIPATYIWDPEDPVRDEAWVLAVTRALDFNTVKMRKTGHAMHLAQPGGLAQVLAGLAGAQRPPYHLPQQRQRENSLQAAYSTSIQ